MSYYFTIDSLTRVTSEVPEPGSWYLIVLGIAVLTLKRSFGGYINKIGVGAERDEKVDNA